LNYCRCLRILDQWTVPNQSSQIADSRPLDDHFIHLFTDCLDDSNASSDLIASIERLKSEITNGLHIRAAFIGGELSRQCPSTVRFEIKSDGTMITVKTTSDSRKIAMIR
jgi:hypothetical protein